MVKVHFKMSTPRYVSQCRGTISYIFLPFFPILPITSDLFPSLPSYSCLSLQPTALVGASWLVPISSQLFLSFPTAYSARRSFLACSHLFPAIPVFPYRLQRSSELRHQSTDTDLPASARGIVPGCTLDWLSFHLQSAPILGSVAECVTTVPHWLVKLIN